MKSHQKESRWFERRPNLKCYESYELSPPTAAQSFEYNSPSRTGAIAEVSSHFSYGERVAGAKMTGKRRVLTISSLRANKAQSHRSRRPFVNSTTQASAWSRWRRISSLGKHFSSLEEKWIHRGNNNDLRSLVSASFVEGNQLPLSFYSANGGAKTVNNVFTKGGRQFDEGKRKRRRGGCQGN